MKQPPRKITVEIITADPTNTDAIKALLEVCRQLSCNYGGQYAAVTDLSAIASNAPSLPMSQLAHCTVCSVVLNPKTIVCFNCFALAYISATSIEEGT